MAMFMGYHYKEPKRGNGYSFEVKGVIYIWFMTKQSANQLKKDFKRRGFVDDEIIIEKNS
jgi:hypothetical protein